MRVFNNRSLVERLWAFRDALAAITTFEVEKLWNRKRMCYFVRASFCVVAFILLARAFKLSLRRDRVIKFSSNKADFVPLTDKRLENFRQALQFRTVSRAAHDYNEEQLTEFGQFILQAYPALHSSPLVKHEFVAKYSLLYSIQGSEPSLTPYMLLGHMDVVPADDESKWEAPPFSGDVINDFIYGRGTMDDKHVVMSILEALEFLFSNGFQPRRSFYVAFGHDEEVGGQDGAKAIAETLKSRGLMKLEFISDEGLTIVTGIVPGIEKPVALVGTSEKGQAVLKLEVKGETGHSSMPAMESSISILARAVIRLQTSPQPSMFGYGPEKATFEHLVPYMDIGFQLIMSNLWLFRPLVSWVMSAKPSTNAIVRTVTAVTMFNAGVKENVIPPEATAIVNHRIHPAQTVQEVIDFDLYIIDDDRVNVTVISSIEPAPVSPHGNKDFGYQVMKSSIRQVWPEAVVAPGMVIGNTDSRHYLDFTHKVYRFSPNYMLPRDLQRIHGLNERISRKTYEQAINFYHHLILNANEEKLPLKHY